MTNTARHIIGYSIGFMLVFILIPWLQYHYSTHHFEPIFMSQFCFMRYLLALPLMSIGLTFGFAANYMLYKIGHGGPLDLLNIAISPRTKRLVTSGPYQYSRNPMVFGASCFYCGIGFLMNSWTAICIAIGFLILMYLYIRFFEEKRLVKYFGKEYLYYKKRAPMIFPFRNLLR